MRVLLLDEGFVSGAATARGLHAAGCDVDVVAAVGGRARCRATGGEWRFSGRIGTARLERDLETAAARRDYDVVYPATEPMQRLVWPRAALWRALRLPTDDAIRPPGLADKRRMSCVARSVGVPIPDQMDCAGASNIDEAIRRFGLPIVIKGAVGRGGRTTFIAASAAEARRAVHWIERQGIEAFAQRHLRGPTFLVGGVFHHGLPVRLYAGEKCIQFPASTGPAAVLISRRDHELIQSATRVFAAMRLNGLASADFIRDDDGRFHFLELNPRPWGSIVAARDVGVDLFAPLVETWRGRAPAARLAFADGVRSPILPLAVLSAAAWRSGDAPRSLRRARGSPGRAPESVAPAFAWHLARRALRVALNW
jgi:hypothetical protein